MFNFALSKVGALLMVQTENIIRHNIAPVKSPVLTGLNNHYKAPIALRQGFLSYLFPMSDFIEANPKRRSEITYSETSRHYPKTDNLGLADKIGIDVKIRNIIIANRNFKRS